MSTNGLLLPKFSEEIINAGIDSLTVTVNAVDPTILAQIVEGVAPEQLIENQLTGIAKVSAAGVTVKVNTVLIPELNGEHVAEIAKAVSKAGARIYNIIPLIPQHKLSWCSAPGCDLLSRVRTEAEEYLRVFRHCQRCRADAAGILGGLDVSQQIYTEKLFATNTFSHG
jgi:nitrogen fixation protein NifB